MNKLLGTTTMLAALTIAAFPALAAEGNAEAGKTIAKSCAGCHGANGEGKANFPAIAGMDEKKMVQDLQDYKSGKRPNGMMKSAAAKLSDADMQNVAEYYAHLKK